jgi:thymidylate synthase (FAD)
MSVKLIWVTPDAEKHMMYCARVSSTDQDSTNTRLLNYCIKHGHWSIFEMASMCVEVVTTRDISAQMIRHKSFSFQEFSQRYAESTNIVLANPRRQDTKNRQNSTDDLDEQTKGWFINQQHRLNTECMKAYKHALDLGVAKECARKLLPMNTETKLYMSGTVRSFIHYLQLRTHESTQLEHRDIANAINDIFKQELPIIHAAIEGVK